MDFKITKQLLKYLLRFRCPKCEFSTINPILIQEHLFQCLKPRKIDITDSVFREYRSRRINAGYQERAD